MMSLIRSRAPSLLLFGAIQTTMWTWVYTRYQQPSLIDGPLPSHIPQGFVGRARFQQQAPFASGYATN
ncbi:hypothetical protein C8Q72DRAFT_884392 [Fomitopsis betulina]|nr:hypothetical protein C8Q72DRAFT_884392 [Fomitopsis betulina]